HLTFNITLTLQQLHALPTRRSSDLIPPPRSYRHRRDRLIGQKPGLPRAPKPGHQSSEIASSLLAESPKLRFSGAKTSCNLRRYRSEEHTSELQSLRHIVCRLLLEKI